MDYQSLTIVGKVGKDPESRFTTNGQQVTSFSVAVNRHYKRGEEKVKETTWFRVSVWGKLAEVCNTYVKKGSEVLIEGRLNPDPTGGPRVYETNGVHKASFEITANSVQFGSRPADAPTPAVEEDNPF